MTMLKNLSQLEHVIGDKIYHFACDSNSPLNEVKDALFQFLKYVGQIEDAVKAQQAPQVANENVPISNESVEAPKEQSKIEAIKIDEPPQV